MCIAWCARPDVPRFVVYPNGMPGGEGVRLLEMPQTPSRRAAQRDWLVVSTVPESMYGEDTLQQRMQDLEWIGPRAMAHEAVIEHFLSSDAVLPMQLFALFTSDARAVEHVVRNQRRIGRILLRIERQVEWGLRLMWDPGAVETAKEGRTGRGRSVQAGRAVSGVGLSCPQAQSAQPVAGAVAARAGRRDSCVSHHRRRGERVPPPKRCRTRGSRVTSASRRCVSGAGASYRSISGRGAQTCGRPRRGGDFGIADRSLAPVQLHLMASRRRPERTLAARIFDSDEASVLEVVDSALNKGVVLSGDLTLALAHVDLVYARLSVLLCAADRVLPSEDRRRHRAAAARPEARSPEMSVCVYTLATRGARRSRVTGLAGERLRTIALGPVAAIVGDMSGSSAAHCRQSASVRSHSDETVASEWCPAPGTVRHDSGRLVGAQSSRHVAAGHTCADASRVSGTGHK